MLIVASWVRPLLTQSPKTNNTFKHNDVNLNSQHVILLQTTHFKSLLNEFNVSIELSF